MALKYKYLLRLAYAYSFDSINNGTGFVDVNVARKEITHNNLKYWEEYIEKNCFEEPIFKNMKPIKLFITSWSLIHE